MRAGTRVATKVAGVAEAADTDLATKVMAVMAVEGATVAGLWVGVERVAAVRAGELRATVGAWAYIVVGEEGW